MTEYSQDIKIVCQNSIMKGSHKATEGHPWRNWKIRVVAVDHHRERKGKLNMLLDHVEYILHPTFENPVRVFSKEPYLLQEKGWGEFDMRVVLYFTDRLAEPENIFFDLHFREHTYTIMHKIRFQNPSPELVRLLTMDVPASDSSLYSSSDSKKRRTSPSLSTSKKIKTPPSTSSPAQMSDSPLTPSYTRYPNSPLNMLYQIQSNDIESNAESDDLFRSLLQKQSANRHSDATIDDIYCEKDVENAKPIHSKYIDDNVRKAWGIPVGLDMLELARRLSSRTPEQIDEIETLIKIHQTDDMLVKETDDEFMIDLYSLGPDLLNQLWEYTEKKMNSNKTTAALSPFSLVQANTAMIDYD